MIPAMLKNFFVNMVRYMRKQKGYVLLNLGGLIIGITSFFFISLYVIHELSYDRFHSDYENIYRLKVVGRMAGSELNQAVTAAPMAQTMLNDYPEILKVTRVREMGDWLIGYGENRFNEEVVLFADSTFFDILDFRLLKGDPETALVRPRSMVMTEEYARKYFGEADPIGQRVTMESDTVLYTITGVVDNVPDNSHIKFDMLASLSTYPQMANDQFWISHSFYTYIEVADGTEKDELQAKLQEMIIKYVGPQLQEVLGYRLDLASLDGAMEHIWAFAVSHHGLFYLSYERGRDQVLRPLIRRQWTSFYPNEERRITLVDLLFDYHPLGGLVMISDLVASYCYENGKDYSSVLGRFKNIVELLDWLVEKSNDLEAKMVDHDPRNQGLRETLRLLAGGLNNDRG